MNTDNNSNANDHTLKTNFNPLMIIAVILGIASCCADYMKLKWKPGLGRQQTNAHYSPDSAFDRQ